MIVLIIIATLVVSGIVWFFVWKHRYIKRLRNRRDEFDITTPEGKWLIQVYNIKIDELNGYRIKRS